MLVRRALIGAALKGGPPSVPQVPDASGRLNASIDG